MNTKATPTSPTSRANGATGATPACPLEFYQPEGYTPENSVGYMMRRILAMVSQQVERELEPTGLTNAQWVPLFKLYVKEADTVAELARCTQMDAGAMTRLLDRLEAKNLVRRLRSQSDRRVVNLELTPEGLEAAQKIPQVLCDVQNRHLVGFTVDEWQSLKGFMRRILDNALAITADEGRTHERHTDSKSQETRHETLSAK